LYSQHLSYARALRWVSTSPSLSTQNIEKINGTTFTGTEIGGFRRMSRAPRITVKFHHKPGAGGRPGENGCPVQAKLELVFFVVTATVLLYERKSPLKAKRGP
jgi:hypothetical protein